jgi:hypothetical protein
MQVTASENVAPSPVARPTDDQDRVLIEHLTDREILVETLTYFRLFTDLMTEAAKNPLLSRIIPLPPGFGK